MTVHDGDWQRVEAPDHLEHLFQTVCVRLTQDGEGVFLTPEVNGEPSMDGVVFMARSQLRGVVLSLGGLWGEGR